MDYGLENVLSKVTVLALFVFLIFYIILFPPSSIPKHQELREQCEKVCFPNQSLGVTEDSTKCICDTKIIYRDIEL